MRIAVIGSSGFVGRHVARRLERDGRAVLRVGRRGAGGADVTIGDLGANDWSPPVPQSIDALIHLAAHSGGGRDTAAAIDAVNVTGTRRMLDFARASGAGHVLFVSSIKVNGERTREGRPFRPDDAPAPVDDYGRSKAAAERLVRDFSETTGARCTIVRPVMVYGREGGANFLRLARLARSGLPLPFARIANRRSLIFVENLADLIARAIEPGHEGCRVFLAADDEDVATPDLIRRMGRAAGAPVRLWPAPAPLIKRAGGALGLGGIVSRLCDDLQADASETRSALGWRSAVDLDAALALSLA